MYTGPWVKMEAPDAPGTMHDDAVARARGFQGGIVGNTSVAAVATPAVVASLGQDWFENGAHKASFAKPTYAADEVRVVWEEVEPDPGDRKKITFVVEKRSGEKALFGWAAVGEPGGPRVAPPWEREPVPPLKPEDDLMPESVVGTTGAVIECSMPQDFLIKHLDSVQEDNWWYRLTSPWGDPVVPPPQLASMVVDLPLRRSRLQGQSLGRRWKGLVAGGRELVVCQPVFAGRLYYAKPELVAKGRARNTFYTVTEFAVDDAEGKRVAVVRSRVNYFLDVLTPSERA